MRVLTILILVAVAVVVAAMAYFRLAPTDLGTWHQRPTGVAPGDRLDTGGFQAVRRITAPAEDVLRTVEEAALATPRTVLAAGSVEEGMLTFESRSALWAFPDYTTVTVEGDLLIIYGRLRFGRSDLGVNKARVTGWLTALAPLTEPV
ncbi:MAG: DUF1499 domain-containing protein [Pseudomonadota bacterium]